METKQPLLSICIPTYNRANVLKDCLKSIVQAEGFSNEVEIVISDNCSIDETQQVCEFFAREYPNIKYFRNDVNIGFGRNLLHVLESGSGAFLKVSNDYNLFRKNSISFLLETIKKHIQDKPVLYFGNQTNSKHSYITSSFDDFFIQEQLGPGWISNYGYWKEDFDNLKNKDKHLDTLFPQLDWFIRFFLKKEQVYCYNELLFINKNLNLTAKTATYNFIKVHSVNYFSLLNPLYENNIIHSVSLEMTKRRCLYYCTWVMIRSIFLNKKYFRYSTDCGWDILKKQFGNYNWYKKTLLKGILFATIAMPFERVTLFFKRLFYAQRHKS